MFPSEIVNAITKFNEEVSSVRKNFEKVPNNADGMHFEFNFKAADGTPSTCAGKLNAEIPGVSKNRSVPAAAHGTGGVGKICALRAIGQRLDNKKRFPRGVIFFFLGRNASDTQLKDRIAYFVEKVRGRKRAETFRKLDQIDDVVNTAGSWLDW